jgi:integrase
MIPRNPCDNADAPKVQREEIRPLDGAQTRRLLRAARGERLEALYVLTVPTGMRPSELPAPKWQDVSFDAGRWAQRWTMLWGRHPLLPHCCHGSGSSFGAVFVFSSFAGKGSEPPRTRTWNLEIKSLSRQVLRG